MEATQTAKAIHAGLIANTAEINQLLRRYGVKFGIYKNGTFKEQFFSF